MDAMWSKETYEASRSSRCWWCTPWDEGWYGSTLAEDAELRAVVAMERRLPEVPDWAEAVVTRGIRYLSPCGHYRFPLAFLEVLSAIGGERAVGYRHGCFTVDGERKAQMADYVLLLDAWVADATPEAAARELAAFGHRRIDWATVCADTWRVLGEHTALKEALVERLVHSQRWKLKDSPWDDEHTQLHARDDYVGDYRAEVSNHCEYSGDPALPFGGWDEGSSPRVQRLDARLGVLLSESDWRLYRYYTTYGWLCAPKAFRYLERLVWSIGREAPPTPQDDVPRFLGCDDLVPDRDAARTWWRGYRAALEAWWRGDSREGGVPEEVGRLLGSPTPVKRWLVRLFLLKCREYTNSIENEDGALLLA